MLFRCGFCALFLLFAQPSVAADAQAGQAAYAVCAACHGPDGAGNQALNAPKIAGQEAWYLLRQMQAFIAGHRGTARGDVPGMQMRPMAMAVSDPTVQANLAAYIESLPSLKPAASVTGDAAKGQAAYAVCAACHGQQAEGNEQLGGPRLAGMDDWYLVRQIQNYQQELRGYHPEDIFGRQMKPMAATLATEQAINDVVAYINSLD